MPWFDNDRPKGDVGWHILAFAIAGDRHSMTAGGADHVGSGLEIGQNGFSALIEIEASLHQAIVASSCFRNGDRQAVVIAAMEPAVDVPGDIPPARIAGGLFGLQT